MPDLDFDSIAVGVEHEFPHWGRQAKGLDPKLVEILHNSFHSNVTACLRVPDERVVTLKNVLNKAGKELNYRIHRDVVPDEKFPGYSLYYFKVVGPRRRDENG